MIEEIVVKNVTVYDNEGINIKDLDKVNCKRQTIRLTLK